MSHKCSNCNAIFIRKAHLQYHETNNSCKTINHTCQLCKKGFTTSNSMYRHMKKYCKFTKDISSDNNCNKNLYDKNLSPYGPENYDLIDYEKMISILKNGFNAVCKMIEYIHFNPEFPQFRNIKITNMRNNYAYFYNGQSWIKCHKSPFIDVVYNNAKKYIQDVLHIYTEVLSISRMNALKRWLSIDDNTSKIKEIKTNIMLLLYNSKDAAI